MEYKDLTKENSFLLGSAPKIQVILETGTPESATIKIISPSNEVLVDDVPMTQVQDRIYNYYFITTTNYTAGTYYAIITITGSGIPTRGKIQFELVEAYSGE